MGALLGRQGRGERTHSVLSADSPEPETAPDAVSPTLGVSYGISTFGNAVWAQRRELVEAYFLSDSRAVEDAAAAVVAGGTGGTPGLDGGGTNILGALSRSATGHGHEDSSHRAERMPDANARSERAAQNRRCVTPASVCAGVGLFELCSCRVANGCVRSAARVLFYSRNYVLFKIFLYVLIVLVVSLQVPASTCHCPRSAALTCALLPTHLFTDHTFD
jgi:hypothetical protein